MQVWLFDRDYAPTIRDATVRYCLSSKPIDRQQCIYPINAYVSSVPDLHTWTSGSYALARCHLPSYSTSLARGRRAQVRSTAVDSDGLLDRRLAPVCAFSTCSSGDSSQSCRLTESSNCSVQHSLNSSLNTLHCCLHDTPYHDDGYNGSTHLPFALSNGERNVRNSTL